MIGHSKSRLRFLPLPAAAIAEDQIERALTTVPGMRAANRSDFPTMPENGQPIADRSPYRAPPGGPFVARRWPSGHEQHDPGAILNRLFKPPFE